MNEKLYEKLFNFDLKGIKNISISDNEIYNQFLLYIFFKYKKNILLVLPTLNEATEKYNDLKSYTDDVYLFPEDDFITKSAIAVSPELLYMRINLLNKIKDDKQKIVIVHLNSFIKKLPNIEKYQNQKIILKTGQRVDRKKLIEKLIDNGYKKESIVYNTADFSVRGFVIDIFPVGEENPVRIEMFDNEIEKIKYFDSMTQRTTSEIKEITISSLNENFNDNDTSIREYINNCPALTEYNVNVNYLEDERFYGAQTFYTIDNKELALAIQRKLKNNLRSPMNAKILSNSIYMYKQLTIPGVLIEVGFLSNSKERDLLIDEYYQDKIVDSIIMGLINYF